MSFAGKVCSEREWDLERAAASSEAVDLRLHKNPLQLIITPGKLRFRQD